MKFIHSKKSTIKMVLNTDEIQYFYAVGQSAIAFHMTQVNLSTDPVIEHWMFEDTVDRDDTFELLLTKLSKSI